MEEKSFEEEITASCAICAWREHCQKKFKVDNRSPIKCPDFSPDYALLKKLKEEEGLDKGKD